MFLYPGYLWFLLLTGPILAMYFVRSRPVTRQVASNSIWKLVLAKVQPNSFLQKFSNSMFLFLQLLVLSLVVFSLARPMGLGNTGLLRVLVVDVSASMLSRDLEPNRFEIALKRARDLAREHRGRLALYLLSDRLVSVIPPLEGSGMILEALDRLKPAHWATPSNERIVRLLRDLEGLRPDEVFLLTDTPSLEIPNDFMPETAFGVEKFGKSVANCGITQAETSWDPSRKTLWAQAQMENTGPALVAGSLETKGGSESEPSIPIQIKPGETQSVQVRLSGSGPFEIRLSVPDGQNILAADDVWYFSDPGVRPRVAMLGKESAVLGRLARVLPLLEFARGEEGQVGSAAAFISVGEPAIWPEIPGCSFLDGGERLDAGGILEWQENHPLFQYLNLDALATDSLRPGNLPGMRLVQTMRGSLISEEIRPRQEQKFSRLRVGLDIDSETLQESVFLPVFLYNALQYLLKDQFPRWSYRVGDPGISRLWRDAVPPTLSGIHEVPGRTGARVGLNLQNGSESRVGPGKPVKPGVNQKAGHLLREQAVSTWMGFLTLGFLVVLLEWYLYLRRN